MLRLPFSPSLPLETERLLLRPLTSADTDALLAYRSDEESCRYLPFPPMDETEIDRRLREQWGRVSFDGPEQNITLGVTLKSTGALIGDVVLFLHSPTSRTGEIGYVLHPAQVGSGYASEAATALLRVAFDELGLHRVVGRLDARNDAIRTSARADRHAAGGPAARRRVAQRRVVVHPHLRDPRAGLVDEDLIGAIGQRSQTGDRQTSG